jgi:hypothetical protein
MHDDVVRKAIEMVPWRNGDGEAGLAMVSTSNLCLLQSLLRIHSSPS